MCKEDRARKGTAKACEQTESLRVGHAFAVFLHSFHALQIPRESMAHIGVATWAGFSLRAAGFGGRETQAEGLLMGIFARLSDIISANLNALLDKAEDPERMLAQVIREMEAGLERELAKLDLSKRMDEELRALKTEIGSP
jgi:hypothetical protein